MKNIFTRLASTESKIAPLILRITYALVLWPHGAQMLLGWFGGYGFSGTMSYFTGEGGLPLVIAFLVILLEFFGSLFILFGFFTRLTAVACIILFIGMILTVHEQFGFFMNWYGNMKGEGFEYHLFGMGILLSLVISGAGKASVDALIARSKNK
ncbi:MAG: DoxX family protein [Mucilaginibacter sp.]|nr:DoxX family protein [Mucilaginibacter sp.]